jgi:hypothetical protein
MTWRIGQLSGGADEKRHQRVHRGTYGLANSSGALGRPTVSRVIPRTSLLSRNASLAESIISKPFGVKAYAKKVIYVHEPKLNYKDINVAREKAVVIVTENKVSSAVSEKSVQVFGGISAT